MEDSSEPPFDSDLHAENGNINGIFSSPTPGGSSKAKRKQWVLHDGPHGSLQRLRLRMAEEGCSHSQVALARQLLSEESKESDQIAVHWLLKAADQGHYEAIDLLKTCLETNRGITEHSYIRVKACLEMTHNERAARTAAKTLFDSMSQGNDFITVQQLESWLEENTIRKSKGTNSQITSYSGNELISEQHVLSAASVYATGHFPPLLSLVNLFSYNLWATFCRRLAHVLSRLPQNFIQILAVLALLLLTFHPPSRSSFPFVFSTWILFLIASIRATGQVFLAREEWDVFRSWSSLLSRQTNQLQPVTPEFLYVSRVYPRTLQLFVATTLPCICLQPVWSSLYGNILEVPYGELAVFALLLFTFCWPPLKQTWDLTLEDLVCVLGWILLRFDYWEISQWSFTYDLHPVLQIRLDVISSLAVLILIPFYVRRIVVYRNVWHFIGWILPHFTSLTWLFFALRWSAVASSSGILRGAGLLAATVFLFSPLTLLSKVYLLLVSVTWFSVSPLIGLEPWASVNVGLIVIAVTRVLLSVARENYPQSFVFSGAWIGKLYRILKAVFVAVCIALLAVRLAKPCNDFSQSNLKTNYSSSSPVESPVPEVDLPETITWEQYRNYCHQPSWKRSSMSASQIACSALDSVPVQWEAIVKEVRITKRSNLVEKIVRLLPDNWAHWLTCRLGEAWTECGESSDASETFATEQCRFLSKVNEQFGVACHLNRYTTMEYEVDVEPHSVRFWETKPFVRLIADHRFNSVARKLINGDVIKFVGIFSVPSVGGPVPELDLSYLECVVCEQGPVYVNTIENKRPTSGTEFVMNALQGTVDFVLPPFVKLNVSHFMPG